MSNNKKMSTRCKVDTSREIRQWIGTLASLGYTIMVLKTLKPVSGLSSGFKKLTHLVKH